MLKLAIASIKTALKKWFTFSGRASRAEYWWAALGLTILQYLFLFFLGALIMGGAMAAGLAGGIAGLGIGLAIMLIMMIPLFILWLGLGCRRLHDTNRSGWWQLLVLIPVIGGIILLVWCCSRGQEADNRFGSPPVLQETKMADWLLPFIVFLVLVILGSFGGEKNEARFNHIESNASESSFATPAPSEPTSVNPAPVAPVISPAVAPASTAPGVAPTGPAAAAMDACEQRMADFAVQKGADPKTYIAQNQPYLMQCRQSLGMAIH